MQSLRTQPDEADGEDAVADESAPDDDAASAGQSR